jgi:hypothetical protein
MEALRSTNLRRVKLLTIKKELVQVNMTYLQNLILNTERGSCEVGVPLPQMILDFPSSRRQI